MCMSCLITVQTHYRTAFPTSEAYEGNYRDEMFQVHT
jgi:hypothetical protein